MNQDQIENGCWRCSCCGEMKPTGLADPSWRWNGQEWEHKCLGHDPQAGHFPARLFE